MQGCSPSRGQRWQGRRARQRGGMPRCEEEEGKGRRDDDGVGGSDLEREEVKLVMGISGCGGSGCENNRP